MSGIGPNNMNLTMLNLLNSVMNNGVVAPATASKQPVTPSVKPQDPTMPDLGLAGTPFNSSSSQPLTVGLLSTPVKQMDAQDAVSLGGSGGSKGSGEASGESSGEGAGEGASGRSNRKSKAGE